MNSKHLGFPETRSIIQIVLSRSSVQETAKLSSEEGSRRMYWATRLHVSSEPCPLRLVGPWPVSCLSLSRYRDQFLVYLVIFSKLMSV
jgi:hypothetical protein